MTKIIQSVCPALLLGILGSVAAHNSCNGYILECAKICKSNCELVETDLKEKS